MLGALAAGSTLDHLRLLAPPVCEAPLLAALHALDNGTAILAVRATGAKTKRNAILFHCPMICAETWGNENEIVILQIIIRIQMIRS